MTTQQTARPPGVPRQVDRDSIIETRSAFFKAEKAARLAITKYEQAQARYLAACKAGGVAVSFE